MLKINVVAVGKVKEKYFADGTNEYVKRLSRFARVSVTEIAEETFSDDGGKIQTVLSREAERIKPQLKGYITALAVEGEKLSSEGFAEMIKSLTDKGCGEITFVIGGSRGLDKSVKGAADKLISFSDMTFPHTLFRLMLTEQLYRAFMINANGTYHK